MKPACAVVLASLLLLVSACARKVDDPADVQAVKDAIAEWDLAWNAGDADKVASLYTAEAIAMAPNQPAGVGREAIRASCQKYFSQFSEENRSIVEDLHVSGDLAVARGTQETRTTSRAGGRPIQDKSKWLSVFRRQGDGSWKIFWEIYNSNLPVSGAVNPPAALPTRDPAPAVKR